MAKTKENQTTEIAVVEVLQPELLEVAKSSGVIITEAQAIGLRFAPFMKTVNEISLKIAELDPENVTEESAKIARRLRLDLVENRGTKGLETVHKELKQESLVRGRLIDNYKNIVLSSSEMSESIAEKIEKHQEKVKVFFEQFKQLQFPELQSEAGKVMTKEVTEALQIVKNLIISHSKNLV